MNKIKNNYLSKKEFWKIIKNNSFANCNNISCMQCPYNKGTKISADTIKYDIKCTLLLKTNTYWPSEDDLRYHYKILIIDKI